MNKLLALSVVVMLLGLSALCAIAFDDDELKALRVETDRLYRENEELLEKNKELWEENIKLEGELRRSQLKSPVQRPFAFEENAKPKKK